MGRGLCRPAGPGGGGGLALDRDLCRKSAAYIAGKALDPATGAWGKMDPQVWAEYLAWLAEAGLLTEAAQSRHPDAGMGTLSLDQLRNADTSAQIPVAAVPPLFTNEFLP
mmetsp:Transcript_9739/g.14751  ORF Transcript_9739/g.14751 Transcript_9739/m.14751 type:complete len:110 (-) Transcript_9739:94-423(-)